MSRLSDFYPLPKGTAFTRFAIALMRAKGDPIQARELGIVGEWSRTTPEVAMCLCAAAATGSTRTSDLTRKGLNVAGDFHRVIKTAVPAADSIASPLAAYRHMASEFVEALRPATILGKLTGARHVPAGISTGAALSGTTAAWVGQAKPIPVSRMDLGAVTVDIAKIGSIVGFTRELVRSSSPNAEAVVRQDMIAAIAQFQDQQFIDPNVAAIADTSPASVTHGVSAVPSSGSSVTQITTDLIAAMATFVTSGVTLEFGAWIMSPRTALYLSTLRTTSGAMAFEQMSPRGGFLFGLPVIVSGGMPVDSGGHTFIALVAANEILLADEGGIEIDASDEATLQLDSAPLAGAQATVSLFQNNLAALRAIRFINWRPRRDGAVALVDGITY